MVVGPAQALAVGRMDLVVVVETARHPPAGSPDHDVVGIAVVAFLQPLEGLVAESYRVIVVRTELQAIGFSPPGHLSAASALEMLMLQYGEADAGCDDNDDDEDDEYQRHDLLGTPLTFSHT